MNKSTKNIPADEVRNEHVVVRIKSDDGRTVESHRQILLKNKKAIFAKIGKGLSSTFANQLNKQIENKIPTYLFLAVYEGWDQPFRLIKCELSGVYTSLNDSQLNFVPKYLHPMQRMISTWFEIKSLKWIAQQETKRICMFTSGKEISSSLRGTTALFRVVIKGTTPIKEIADQVFNEKKKEPNLSDDFAEIEDDFNQDEIDSIVGSRNR
jgi:hypothetical protein